MSLSARVGDGPVVGSTETAFVPSGPSANILSKAFSFLDASRCASKEVRFDRDVDAGLAATERGGVREWRQRATIHGSQTGFNGGAKISL